MVIRDLENFNAEEQNQAFVVDDAIPGNLSDGEKKTIQGKIKTWLQNMSTGPTKPFIIFTSVENRKKTFTYITSTASDKDLKIINLNDRLTSDDRTEILNSHFTVFCRKKEF